MTASEILDRVYPNGWRVVRVWENEYRPDGARAVQVGIALRRGGDKLQNSVRLIDPPKYVTGHNTAITTALALLNTWAEDLP